MKKFLALLLVVLIGIPSVVTPEAKGAVCPMPQNSAEPSCSYCAPATSSAPTFETSCCRFLPTPESLAAQASSLAATPKPTQSPDVAAVIPAFDGLSFAARPGLRAGATRGVSPPQIPTRTTHLLL